MNKTLSNNLEMEEAQSISFLKQIKTSIKM